VSKRETGIVPASMMRFHDALTRYLRSPDPVFYVRGKSEARRSVVRSKLGLLIAQTDNAPAWWAHWVTTTSGSSIDFATVPTHMFDAIAGGADTINRGRYYVAHIVPAKLGPRDPDQWTRDQAVARFVCNIHPVNHFYVPMAHRRLGEDRQVIANAAALAAATHEEVWRAFLALAGPEADAYLAGLPPAGAEPTIASDAHRALVTSGRRIPETEPGVEYSSTRLEFRADVIEQLAWDARFRVVTPFGTYEFTKREFYDAFPNIVTTKSYRVGRRYHGARLHLRAERFRLED